MEEFYIDVELSRGLTRIQADEVQPEHWARPYIPQFVIEYHNGKNFIILTIQLENGIWYDRNTRLAEDDSHLRYFELGSEKTWNPNYQSSLSETELKNIGMAISNYMVVRLTTYMGLFIPQYRTPTLN